MYQVQQTMVCTHMHLTFMINVNMHKSVLWSEPVDHGSLYLKQWSNPTQTQTVFEGIYVN